MLSQIQTQAATTRRRFLAGGGALVLTPVHSIAALDLDTTYWLQQHLRAGEALVLYRQDAAAAAGFATTLAEAGIETQRLEQDVVQQWRTGLGRRFVERKQLLLGLGDWNDYCLLRGLAAECRRFPLLELQHPAGGDAVWAASHARALLQLQRTPTASPAAAVGPGLFTWIIG